jgi:hypothetical protein
VVLGSQDSLLKQTHLFRYSDKLGQVERVGKLNL